MKFTRRIAMLLIMLTLASPAWAMACAAACAHGPMTDMTASDTPCCPDAANADLAGNMSDCPMAASCHFAGAAAISASASKFFAPSHTLPQVLHATAPPSAERSPPLKPPA